MTEKTRARRRGPFDSFERPLRLTVRRASAKLARTLLARYGARFEVTVSRSRVSFTIANPRGLPADSHPFALNLARDLRRLGARVVSYSVP